MSPLTLTPKANGPGRFTAPILTMLAAAPLCFGSIMGFRLRRQVESSVKLADGGHSIRA